MVVRIRFGAGQTIAKRKGKNRGLALGFGALLTPVAVMALALGIWRLAADMKWAGAFGISSGLFSHWQVWFACGVLLQRFGWMLTRYGRGGGDRAPS